MPSSAARLRVDGNRAPAPKPPSAMACRNAAASCRDRGNVEARSSNGTHSAAPAGGDSLPLDRAEYCLGIAAAYGSSRALTSRDGTQATSSVTEAESIRGWQIATLLQRSFFLRGNTDTADLSEQMTLNKASQGVRLDTTPPRRGDKVHGQGIACHFR
jgi:hypothetical protein